MQKRVDHVTPKATRPDRVVASPDACRDAILEVIAGAATDISLALFRCNDKEIFRALKHACARGVTVTALVTARADGSTKKLEKLRQALLDAGARVTVYADPVVKYHAKYLVADEGPAIVASLNFTKKCFKRTLDAMVITWDPAVVSGLRALTAADREARPLPASVSPRLVVGPEKARTQLMDLLRGAVSSIRLLDAKLSDPALVALLAERRASGVHVEVLDRKKYGDLKSHGKVCLIDDRLAVVGGLAMSALSLDFRREVAIIVDQRDAVTEVRAFLDAIVARSAGGPEAARPG